MFLLLPLIFFLSPGRADIAVFNSAVDKLLLEAKDVIIKSGGDVLPLAEFEDVFSYRWHFIKVRSYLHCWDGVMKNTSTLQRSGDVVVSNSTDQVTLLIPLNLTQFEMSFNNCRVDIKHLVRKTAPVWSRIDQNTIVAKVVLNMNDARDCTATLEKLEVTEAKKIQFRSDGLVREAQERIYPSIIRHILTQLTSFMSKYLNELIKEYVPDAKLCINTN